jgi:4-amino-4-deoxy-L-arabinose transferase-like glycosyltransferase
VTLGHLQPGPGLLPPVPGTGTGLRERHARAAAALRVQPTRGVWPPIGPRTRRLVLAAILLIAAGLRLWQINAVGLNSDETVYAGQGASIASTPELAPYFPTFRAHPLLFQALLSIGYHFDADETFGRVAAAVLGVATVYVTYLLGRLLYGARAGLIAAALLAVMPYHVVVTRQILLDGPRTLLTTLTVYLLARYALTERLTWFYAAAAALGLAVLCKEDSVILLGAFYAFLALTPALRIDIRNLIGAAAIFILIVAAMSVALDWAGKTGTGGDYIAWQLFRRPNHSFLFYPAVVPVALGAGVLAAAGAGMWLLRSDASWRETLLLSWIAVPAAFFQLFPVKGFQYLLPIAPALAVLAGRFLSHWDPRSVPSPTGVLRLSGVPGARFTVPVALGVVLVSLVIPTWQRVQPSNASTLLAGSGGLPRGREAGRWIAGNVPQGAQMMSIGPSMANVLQFYGHRKVYGLSVSPNPLHRNPVYEALHNPDRSIRDNELQYIVWDAFSASRSPFFARRMARFVERYHGYVVHTETVSVRSPEGRPVDKPVIVIFEVRP